MASRADSEEQLGEEAPAGTPTWGPESGGMPERGYKDDTAGENPTTGVEGESIPVPEAGIETAPSNGTGGEPAVGGTRRDTDTSNPA
jgi:hypothetical protein